MKNSRKDPAAVKLGRKGGLRSAALRTPEQQHAMSSKGGRNRWKNQKALSTNALAVYQRERRRRIKLEQEQRKEGNPNEL